MNFGPNTGLYVWRCHILKNEDYVMMRLLRVIQYLSVLPPLTKNKMD
jgi:hypothetical protein